MLQSVLVYFRDDFNNCFERKWEEGCDYQVAIYLHTFLGGIFKTKEYTKFRNTGWELSSVQYTADSNNTDSNCTGPLICRFFPNKLQCYTICMVGRIHGCGTMDTKGPAKLYADFHLGRVGGPNPFVVQESNVWPTESYTSCVNIKQNRL